jgi:hypothetical protein
VSGLRGRINFGNLKNYLKRLTKAFSGNENKVNADEFFKDVLRTAGKRVQYRAEKRTPVDTGQLRKNWKVHDEKVRGWNYTVEVENPIEYASYVEFGHRVGNADNLPKGSKMGRSRRGRKKEALNKQKGEQAKTWVEGRFMLTKSVDETKQEMGKLVNEKIEKIKRENNL